MRTSNLQKTLEDLHGSTPDIEVSALISKEGAMIAAILQKDMDADRVGAMSSTVLALGGRVISKLERGDLEYVLIQGREGAVVIMAVGGGAVLTATAKAGAQLGLLFMNMKRTVQSLVAELP